MKRIVMTAFLCVLSLFPAAADDAAANAKPFVILFDIATTSYDPGKSRLLTDVFRAELFKTKLFSIIEKGVLLEAGAANKIGALDKADDSQLLQIGRAVKGDKLFISSVEKIASTIAISIRIVDVATSLIDYTDNVFVPDEARIFDALKEIAVKIEFFYATGKKGSDKDPEAELAGRWKLLGAAGDELQYLVSSRVDTEEYLTIRQYDITFTPKQYAAVLRSKIDPGVIKSFLQSGISYAQTERAIALGITKLDRFRDAFQKAGYGFEDYLEAYRKNLMSTADYAAYKKGFQQNYYNIGLGGVADSWPVASAAYKFLLGKGSWERFWSPYQRDTFKFSTDAGLFLMNIFAPVPFFQLNAYVGKYPYYFKLGAGAHAEVILGGHFGAFVQFGLEIQELLDFSLIMVPFGTQPSVSYTDLQSRPGDAGYTNIVFPYAGFLVTYKLPARF